MYENNTHTQLGVCDTVLAQGHLATIMCLSMRNCLFTGGNAFVCSLNKMHAMEGAAGNGKKVDDPTEKSRDDESSRASPKVPQNQQNGAALPEETAAAPATIECLRSAPIKKESLCDSEPEVTGKNHSAAAETMQQKPVASRGAKSETEGGRKRKLTDGQLSSNGNSTPKKFCIEQREQYISSLVGCEKVTAEELAARADQLRAEVQVNIYIYIYIYIYESFILKVGQVHFLKKNKDNDKYI